MPSKSDERAPVAPHRLAPRGWTRIFTFLLILVAGGAIARAGIYYLDQNGDGKSWWEFLPWVQAEAKASVAPSYTPSVTASPTASPSPTAEPTYNFKTRITVYNVSSNATLAGEIATMIGDSSDFTVIKTAKWSGAKPPANVVRFEDPKLADTAAYVAQLLGIQTVASGPVSAGGIAVLLVDDPRPQPTVTPSPTVSATP